MKKSPTKARYNLGRTLLLAALAGMLPDHAVRACRAALAILKGLPGLNDDWQATLKEPIGLGIGINTGMAQVGNVGSRHKFKYGPLGNTVTLGSRVQGATKHLRTGMLVTAAGMALLAVPATRADLTVVALVVAGAGLGLFVAANTAATMFSAPQEKAGAAGGLLNMARGLGSALGVALTSLVIASGRGIMSVALMLLFVALLAGAISVTWPGSSVPAASSV